MVNFNQDLTHKLLKNLKHSPVIEVENDLYRVDLETDPDTLINVICRNIQTAIRSTSRDHYYQMGVEFSISNEKEIKAKCHFIAKKRSYLSEAKEIYKLKSYNK